MCIYRNLRPTLILLFCFGFDLFPPTESGFCMRLIRRCINFVQYTFLVILWLNTLIYRTTFTLYESILGVRTLSEAATASVGASFILFDLFVIAFLIRMSRSGQSLWHRYFH
jgi:hypothetical protein